MNKILPLSGAHVAENYPYGSLRTTATFTVDFDKKKGFRHCFQTVNPKNGRVNNPKKGTYCEFCWNEVDPSNGHILQKSFRIAGPDDARTAFDFIFANQAELGMSNEMIIFLYKHTHDVLVGTIQWSSNREAAREKFRPAIAALRKSIEDNTGVFSQLVELENKKEENSLAEAIRNNGAYDNEA